VKSLFLAQAFCPLDVKRDTWLPGTLVRGGFGRCLENIQWRAFSELSIDLHNIGYRRSIKDLGQGAIGGLPSFW